MNPSTTRRKIARLSPLAAVAAAAVLTACGSSSGDSTAADATTAAATSTATSADAAADTATSTNTNGGTVAVATLFDRNEPPRDDEVVPDLVVDQVESV